MLSFRQEGDMGRYVADNDPGGIAAGFSNLEDFLAAGNKIPEYMTSREPLKAANPLLSLPSGDPFSDVSAPGNIPDRYKEGFVDFYKQNPDDFMRMGGQAISYVTTPQGERIQFGDTGSANNFRRYLESIGETPKPDLNLVTSIQQPLAPKFDKTPGLPPPEPLNPNDIIEPLKTIPQNTQSFNRQGQLLMGYDDQFSGINDRLNKIEEGIASLVQNRGQGLNMNTGGLGYFFNPFGGFYG
jgi:hypothetical protein|tara:strand:+ start:207 stop:929 length:723 start_codon:yes stop_codon:yes gene_type:complete